MTRRTASIVSFAALVAVGLGVAVLVSPAEPGVTAEVYLYVVVALVIAASLVAIARALPRAEPAPAVAPPRSERVGQLESVARALDLAEKSAFNVHTVLRPIVSEIAAERLSRRGVSLDRRPERARVLLGSQTWDIVRPDREAPARGSVDLGRSRDELREIVESLEAI